MRPELMIFEPYSGGHRPEYLCHLLRAWRDLHCPGRVILATSAGLLQEQPGLSGGLLDGNWAEVVNFGDLSKQGRPGLFSLGCRNARLLRALILRYKPKRVLAMYFDHLQLGLAFGLRFDFDVRISGILFRPSYGAHSRLLSQSWFRNKQKEFVLRLAASNRHTDALFSLDPRAISFLRHRGYRKVIALPDPVGRDEEQFTGDARARYGVGIHRRLWTLFGVLDERKGVIQSLQAIHHLDVPDVQRVCLLLMGLQSDELRTTIAPLTASAQGRGLQLIVVDKHVSMADIRQAVESSDLVLAPYQNHVGSSGVLLRAAAAGRPVLSQSFGLMGYNVRQHGLGLDVDTTNVRTLASAMQALLRDPLIGFDPDGARRFAEANTPLAFTSVLLKNMGLFPDCCR